LARAQGAAGIGPIKEISRLKPSLADALEYVKKGHVCVVDVRVMPGYDAPMSGGASSPRR
jgi:hypothetical protein